MTSLIASLMTQDEVRGDGRMLVGRMGREVRLSASECI